MTGALSSVFPRPQSGDTDDVVWTLQTAAVQWQRGLRADAIVWVRRAADTSVQTGQPERAEELRDHASRLAEFLWTEPQDNSGASGLSNPTMPQHPQTLQEIAALDELEDEAIMLEDYELQVSSRRPDSVSMANASAANASAADVTDLTLDDLDEEVLDGELLEDDLLENVILEDELLEDDSELVEDDMTPPDGVPRSIDIVLSDSDQAPRDSFMSISPEDEEDDSDVGSSRDSFISISPESELPEASERPTLPHPAAPSSDALSDAELEPAAVPVVSPAVRHSSIPPTLRWQKRDQEDAKPVLVSLSHSSENPEESPELEISTSDPAALRAEILSTPPDESLDTALTEALLEDLAAVELLSEMSGGVAGKAVGNVASNRISGFSLESAESEDDVPPQPEGPPELNGLALEDAEVVADLPEDAQRLLVATAEMHSIDVHESLLLEEGIALVTEGSIHVMLDGSEVSAARLGVGAVVAIDGSLGRQPLELVADASTPRLAVWSQETLDAAMSDCPWVVDDLRVLADRFQAQAGAGQGEMGGRLDDALRTAVYERLEVKVLQPEEVVAVSGKPLAGLFIVAAGQLLAKSPDGTQQMSAGEFVFAGCVIGAEPAPADVTAGPSGALVLFASRPVAHELMMSVPPLLEILAG